MITIHDEQPGLHRFPLWLLMNALELNFGLLDTDMVRIDRIGGPGERIWALESVIDDGGTVVLPYCEIRSIALGDDDYLDELRCIHRKVAFGIFDATFLFVQGEDKLAEQRVGAMFQTVKACPDQRFA